VRYLCSGTAVSCRWIGGIRSSGTAVLPHKNIHQLELDAFPLKLDVNPNLVNDVNNITTDEQYAEFLRKMYTQYFQESEDIIRTA